MTKKIVLAVVVMLTAAGAAGAETMIIDGQFRRVAIDPLKKYSGEKEYAGKKEYAKKQKNFYWDWDIKLTKEEQAAVNELLDRYETERGDTFNIRIGSTDNSDITIVILCEFTSDTRYNKWVYKIETIK